MIVLSLICSYLCAQDQPVISGKGDWGDEVAGLACRITTDREQYTIGDKVYILVEVSNRTNRPIMLGIEPLIDVGNGLLIRQSASIIISFSQEDHGRLGYFCDYQPNFPSGTMREAQAIVIEAGKTYSALISQTPWGPSWGCIPSEAQPGLMKLKVALSQFLSGELKKKWIKSNEIELTVKKKTNDVNQVSEISAHKLAEPKR